MAVQDCEITLRWVEFEGGRKRGFPMDDALDQTYFAAINGEKALFGEWNGGGEFPIIDPESYDTDVEHEIPLAVLRRVQRSMAEPNWTESTTDGHGEFRKEGEDRVVYTTSCGQEYEFNLDDIIELFGP